LLKLSESIKQVAKHFLKIIAGANVFLRCYSQYQWTLYYFLFYFL